MDYGISLKEKRKEVREEGGNGRKGLCERRMLCDAAVGCFWPSKEEGLQSCLACEATSDLLHAPSCSRCNPSQLVTHTTHTHTHTIQANFPPARQGPLEPTGMGHTFTLSISSSLSSGVKASNPPAWVMIQQLR